MVGLRLVVAVERFRRRGLELVDEEVLERLPSRMAWSDLKSEVVFVPLLRMRIVNVAQNAHNIAFVATISRLYIVMTASGNHRCSIERSPSDILARSITNSPQYMQLQCGRNPRSALQNVYLVT